jgi:hypothetical protein
MRNPDVMIADPRCFRWMLRVYLSALEQRLAAPALKWN